jgi:hypothetical protein
MVEVVAHDSTSRKVSSIARAAREEGGGEPLRACARR